MVVYATNARVLSEFLRTLFHFRHLIYMCILVVIKCYIKCPLKIKKRAYTRDAIYHQKRRVFTAPSLVGPDKPACPQN